MIMDKACQTYYLNFFIPKGMNKSQRGAREYSGINMEYRLAVALYQAPNQVKVAVVLRPIPEAEVESSTDNNHGYPLKKLAKTLKFLDETATTLGKKDVGAITVPRSRQKWGPDTKLRRMVAQGRFESINRLVLNDRF